jgi:uncharacterized tellurite resistance protein B-like protein
MFESLKAWLHADPPHSFKDTKDAKLHVALASLLFHLMDADHRRTAKEKQLFTKILCDEFDLTELQTDQLYERAKTLKSDLSTDLETVTHFLKESPSTRMVFMEKLNHLGTLDGVNSAELSLFYEAMSTIFPDIPPSIIHQEKF